jgi:hypothetical protein
MGRVFWPGFESLNFRLQLHQLIFFEGQTGGVFSPLFFFSHRIFLFVRFVPLANVIWHQMGPRFHFKNSALRAKQIRHPVEFFQPTRTFRSLLSDGVPRIIRINARHNYSNVFGFG